MLFLHDICRTCRYGDAPVYLSYYSPYRWSHLHLWPKVTFQKQILTVLVSRLNRFREFPLLSRKMPRSSLGPLRPCVICRLINPCPPPPSALASQLSCLFLQRPRPPDTSWFSQNHAVPSAWMTVPPSPFPWLDIAPYPPGFGSNSDSWGKRSLIPDQMPHLMLSYGPFSTPCVTDLISQVTALLAVWCLGVHSQTQSSTRAGNSFTLFITESPMPIKCLALFYSRNVCEGGEESSEKGGGWGEGGRD